MKINVSSPSLPQLQHLMKIKVIPPIIKAIIKNKKKKTNSQ